MQCRKCCGFGVSTEEGRIFVNPTPPVCTRCDGTGVEPVKDDIDIPGLLVKPYQQLIKEVWGFFLSTDLCEECRKVLPRSCQHHSKEFFELDSRVKRAIS